LALVFVDAGPWIALSSPRDGFRQQARSYFRDFAVHDRLVTSNYVIQEAITYLVYHDLRRFAFALRDTIDASTALGRLRVEWVDQAIHETSWDVFERFDNQRLSFVDCSSIAICLSQGIETAFSFDRHFTTAGITRVPNP
jgi:hypothetical protein